MQLSLSTAIVALAALVGTVVGDSEETHTVRLNNFCGVGGPVLVQNGTILSVGPTYTSKGPLIGAVAYLQNNGRCGINGENCTAIRTSLRNRKIILSSSTSVDTSPPYNFTFSAAFSYFNGCDGSGAYCNAPACPAQDVSVVCKQDNVGLTISFCA